MDPYVLADALDLVLQNKGSSGVDEVTCSAIKGKEWAFVVDLSEKLRRKTYRPRPVKRVYIPKGDGRKRPLGIPTLEDRVVQRTLVLLMEPIYEELFLPCSHGFRPKKSAKDCAAVVANVVFRNRHVIDADIEGFFDNVQHRKLLGMLREEIVDPRILNLIKYILKAGYMEADKIWQASEMGTPQGGPLSPLLANIYLHYALDTKFKTHATGAYLVRYADDFIIATRTKKELRRVFKLLKAWLHEVGLKLKLEKTRLVDMRNKVRGYESKFDFLGFKFHLRAFKDNPKRFWIARQPSEKARKKLGEFLRSRLLPTLSVKQAKEQAKLIWSGWSEYFRYSNANRVFYKQVRAIKRAVIRYLRMKYRRTRRPVPWKVLRKQVTYILLGIRPVRVIPDLLRQRQAQPMLAATL